MTSKKSTPEQSQPQTILEIKDAPVIFSAVWETLVEEFGHEGLQFPKELILLGGAPGSGKGTQTNYILKSRGLTCTPIIVSGLLNSPLAIALKDAGKLVGDKDVVELVFRELLKAEHRDGALLDGFPRTQVQVECLKLLVDKINELHAKYSHTSLAMNFRRPTIHAMVLFVTEKTSVERQLFRGEEIVEHNKEVVESGVGKLLELRETDIQKESATARYQVFKEQTWDALQSLKEIYHYHFVNAEGPISEVEENINKELRYQSSLELDPEAYDRLSPLPIAQNFKLRARVQLVKRLDSYEINNKDLFADVVQIIKDSFIPIVERHAISGKARVSSENKIFDDPLALSMLIDVFTERGFHVTVDKQFYVVPQRFDLKTGEIHSERKAVYRIQINFPESTIRRG
ncbi:MAG: adenylate kinase [Saprospiraceae bacterium]|jgi:adenylate kinase